MIGKEIAGLRKEKGMTESLTLVTRRVDETISKTISIIEMCCLKSIRRLAKAKLQLPLHRRRDQ